MNPFHTTLQKDSNYVLFISFLVGMYPQFVGVLGYKLILITNLPFFFPFKDKENVMRF